MVGVTVKCLRSIICVHFHFKNYILNAVTNIKSLSTITSSPPLLPLQIQTSGVQPTVTMSPGSSVNQLVVTVAVVVSFLVALSSAVVGCIILIAVLKCVKAGRVQSYPVQERVGKIDNLDNPVYEYDSKLILTVPKYEYC